MYQPGEIATHHEPRGDGVTDLRAYCYASQLQWLAYWLAGRNLYELDMSLQARDKGIIHRLLLPQALLSTSTLHLLKLAITYWRSAVRYTGQTTPYAPTVPLLGIPTRSDLTSNHALQA